MIEVIIITHGDLAKAFKESAELIVGEQKYIQTFCLKHGDSVDELKENIYQTISDSLSNHNDVIVLTDMFSGSPFNAVVANMKELDFSHVTGLNLPMLLEILAMRETHSIKEIYNTIVECGHQSIKAVNDMIRR